MRTEDKNKLTKCSRSTACFITRGSRKREMHTDLILTGGIDFGQ